MGYTGVKLSGFRHFALSLFLFSINMNIPLRRWRTGTQLRVCLPSLLPQRAIWWAFRRDRRGIPALDGRRTRVWGWMRIAPFSTYYPDFFFSSILRVACCIAPRAHAKHLIFTTLLPATAGVAPVGRFCLLVLRGWPRHRHIPSHRLPYRCIMLTCAPGEPAWDAYLHQGMFLQWTWDL